jgi:hypothetical protein
MIYTTLHVTETIFAFALMVLLVVIFLLPSRVLCLQPSMNVIPKQHPNWSF